MAESLDDLSIKFAPVLFRRTKRNAVPAVLWNHTTVQVGSRQRDVNIEAGMDGINKVIVVVSTGMVGDSVYTLCTTFGGGDKTMVIGG